MPMRLHPLVWGVNPDWTDLQTDLVMTPKWVHEGKFSRAQMIDIMYDQIETTMTRYQDRIDEWIVVNEAFGGFNGEQGIAPMNTVWTQKLGDDYVESAFKYADQVDPEATLILNEVNAEHHLPWDNRTDDFYLFASDLVERGTPIDVVGFQFHWTVGLDNPTVEDITDNFARYGELGLVVYITEMDVDIELPVTPEDLEEQARLYSVALQACLESEYCKSFAVWGHADEYSWIPQFFPGHGAATLFDENMQPKLACYGMIEVMKRFIEK